MFLLPLRGLPNKQPHPTIKSLSAEFGMRNTIDGAESSDCHCRNLWAAYRDIRAPPRRYVAMPSRPDREGEV